MRERKLTAVNSRTAPQSAPQNLTPFVAPMVQLMETSASSALLFCKYEAHHAAMKPEEPGRTQRQQLMWKPPTPVSPLVNPALLHIPLLALTPLSPPRHRRSSA